MYPTRADLAATTGERVIALLQTRLADSVDLFPQVKQAHWNVADPQFIALHELFDKVAEVIEDHSDLMAERIIALGGRAAGAARVAAATSMLGEYPLAALRGDEHVAALADRLAAFGVAIRKAIDEAAALGDVGTADVLTEISREIDKQLWFVEAHSRT